ncbi:MAG: ribulose-phosphate 3-epimerase [Bacteroidetes bacterium]|jgi:ribulose-phosphate 3-epimerase|nr:ribulose-phosphate 3-epimerase [Bacteroidota bacterium]
MEHKIAPSILSSNFLNLKSDIEMLNKSEADLIHCDVMDGVFVPNISFGFPVLEQVRDIAAKPLDVHLMIVNPDKFIPEVKAAGAYIMNVHYEACIHLHRTVCAIKQAGMKAAVTLNPHTPVHLLDDILEELDMVLIMSVDPGFGAQKFIEHSLQKISTLKEMILRKNLKTLIEVDGGINQETAKLVLNAGADVLVAGNAVFKSKDPLAAISEMKHLSRE